MFKLNIIKKMIEEIYIISIPNLYMTIDSQIYYLYATIFIDFFSKIITLYIFYFDNDSKIHMLFNV